MRYVRCVLVVASVVAAVLVLPIPAHASFQTGTLGGETFNDIQVILTGPDTGGGAASFPFIDTASGHFSYFIPLETFDGLDVFPALVFHFALDFAPFSLDPFANAGQSVTEPMTLSASIVPGTINCIPFCRDYGSGFGTIRVGWKAAPDLGIQTLSANFTLVDEPGTLGLLAILLVVISPLAVNLIQQR